MQFRKLALLLGLGAAIAAFFVFDLGQYLNLQTLKDQQEAIRRFHANSPLLSVSVYFLIYVATIRQTALEFDSMKPEAIVARLKPMAVPGNAWFGSAGEMTALAYARMEKPALAAKMFEDMAKDDKVPESIKARAKAMASSLAPAPATPAAKEDTQ